MPPEADLLACSVLLVFVPRDRAAIGHRGALAHLIYRFAPADNQPAFDP